jgi:hypothetical protein
MFKIMRNKLLLNFCSFAIICLFYSCQGPENVYLENKSNDTIIIKECIVSPDNGKISESQHNHFGYEYHARDCISLSTTKYEFDTCNHCINFFVFPDEKIQIMRTYSGRLLEANWDFNHLEIILSDGKIVADNHGILILFEIKGEDYPRDYILTIE